MKMGISKNRINEMLSRNAGTTLVEMIVCFALLAIFVTAAASIIASTTNLYYQVKGETYSGQITDILMEKIASEIEGAKYDDSEYKDTPKIGTQDGISYIDLYNRSETHIRMCAQNNELLVYYYRINNTTDVNLNRDATIWKFDEKMYNGYKVEELMFIPGNEISTHKAKLSEYGFDADAVQYDNNIVLVLLAIDSGKYGTYRTVRPIKMYNVPENYTWPTD